MREFYSWNQIFPYIKWLSPDLTDIERINFMDGLYKTWCEGTQAGGFIWMCRMIY